MAADSVTPEVRSRMMAGIRGKNTKPELAMRSALHGRGFRFRLHCNELPGKPDLVFPKFRAVIFVNGCFWHGHGCHLFKWPKTRSEFWQRKINSNIDRDRRQRLALFSAGWRVATVWECALKGRTSVSVDEIAEECAAWLESDQNELRLSGNETRTIA